jgi:hypothetical protein
MLLRGLAIFSLACIATVLATNDGCKLVVYNEEDFKGSQETLRDTKLVEMEIKSFRVHGYCRWSMDKVLK